MSSCFRCSPEQKAAVVKLIERHTGKRSAAIGIFTSHTISVPSIFHLIFCFWRLIFFLQEMAEMTYLWYRQLAWESALWARRASRPAWQPTSQSLRLESGLLPILTVMQCPGSRSVSQRYGSGSFPFLIKMLSVLSNAFKIFNAKFIFKAVSG